MWSAIPVALLCMIVKWSERKQGSGPEGDKVLWNTGGLSLSCLKKWMRCYRGLQEPKLRADLRLESDGLRLERLED